MARKNKVETYTVEYVGSKDFAQRYGLLEMTVKKRYKDIKGAVYRKGQILIPDSARYPYNIGFNKMKSRDDKIYVLLKATSRFYYIDNKVLKMSKPSFETMVKELANKGLLIKNESNDRNGINSYDVCQSIDEILRKPRIQAMKEISCLLAQMSGSFIASIVNH